MGQTRITTTPARSTPLANQRYENAYLFGAICPARGTCAGLTLPYANTFATQLSLDEISRHVAKKEVLDTKLDFADFCAVGSDAGPEDRRFRDDAHGLFDGGGGASKGAERNPSFLPQ